MTVLPALPPVATAVRLGEFPTLFVDYPDGLTAHVDLAPLLERPLFAPLRDPAFFTAVKLADGGACLAWSEELDLDTRALRLPPANTTLSGPRLIFLEPTNP